MERDYYKKNIRDKEVLKQKSTKTKDDIGNYEMRKTKLEEFSLSKAKGDRPIEAVNIKEGRSIKESLGKYSKLTAKKDKGSNVSETERLKEHFKEAVKSKPDINSKKSDSKRLYKKKTKVYKKESGRYKDRILFDDANVYAKIKATDDAVSEKEDDENTTSEQILSDIPKSTTQSKKIISNTVGNIYVKKATPKEKKNPKTFAHKQPDYRVQNEKTVFRKHKQYQAEHKSLTQMVEETKQQVVKIISRLKEMFSVKRTVIGIIAVLILTIVIVVASVFSVGVGVANGVGIYLMGLSMSEDANMTEADNYFSEKEMLLQESIDNIQEDYPDFDEYVFDVDEIGHDPILLMAFLSSIYESYTLDEVKDMLDAIFDSLYNLELVEAIEERSRQVFNEETGEYDEEIYYVKVLYVTLTKGDLLQILSGYLTTDDEREMFEIYTDTEGAHQSYINPFDFDWTANISSAFGWRIHPISGQEKFHNGVDIALPTGTNIGSCSKGVVIKSYYSQSAGNYIVIEDESGYRCHYMHLNERYVSVGDVVNYGDVIGTVGNTGNSTGPHLHLGVENEDHKWINPIFVVSNYVR